MYPASLLPWRFRFRKVVDANRPRRYIQAGTVHSSLKPFISVYYLQVSSKAIPPMPYVKSTRRRGSKHKRIIEHWESQLTLSSISLSWGTQNSSLISQSYVAVPSACRQVRWQCSRSNNISLAAGDITWGHLDLSVKPSRKDEFIWNTSLQARIILRYLK